MAGVINELPIDSELQSMHPLISWRSVAAGLLISIFFMIGLLGLGMAFGGIGLEDGTTARSAGIYTGAWFLGSALVSLFFGSYFAARISKFQLGRIGSAQGLVIAALFLGFFLFEAFMVIGGIGQLTGSAIGKSVGVVGDAGQSLAKIPAVRNVVNEAVVDLNFNSDPQVVASGVASRLIQGDADGAKNFLATEAGITEAQADQRIAAAKVKLDEVKDKAQAGAAQALKSTGWSLFLLVFLGSAFGALGGSIGSVANYRKPLADREYFSHEVHV
jgi:hypothetical protein